MMIVAGGMLALALYAQNTQKSRDAAENAPAANTPSAVADGNAADNAAANAVAVATSDETPVSGSALTAATRPSDTTTPDDASAEATEPAITQTTSPSVSPTDAPARTEPAWAIDDDMAPTRKETIGSLDPKDGYAMQLEFVTDGASIYTAKLANYYTTVADLRAARQAANQPGGHAEYLARVGKEPGLHGHYSLLNPLSRTGDSFAAAHLDAAYGTDRQARSFSQELHLPLATRSVSLRYDDGRTATFDIEHKRWKIQSIQRHDDGRQEITFILTLLRTLPSQPQQRYLELIKTYTLVPGATPGDIQYGQRPYSVRVELKARNLSSDSFRVVVDQSGVTGVPREDLQRDMRRLVWTRIDQGGGKLITQRRDAQDKKLADSEDLGSPQDTQPLLWVAQTNKFFAGVLYLMPQNAGPPDVLIPGRAATWNQRRIVETQHSHTFLTGVKLEMNPAADGEDSLAMDLFVGPKRTELFNNTPLYESLHYTNTIEIGQGCCFSWCTVDWLAKFIMTFLEFIARYVGNFGVAIIILVIIVRVLLHPLTKRGQIAMSKMAKLGPKMKELQEKYKNDKDTLNREMLKHSKEQAGMFMGCLPMLLQLPIWMALYSGLQADAELRHTPFLPVWITDLAGPDAIIRFDQSFQVPLIGAVASLNLLPLLLTVAMYLQSKLTPTPTAPATTREQEMQQKMQKRMMQIMMPLMMLLFFYNAPSGLNLYIMTSTFSSVFEQIIIRKHIREREAAQAANPTEVVVPTKAPRDNRPKKPKGPFWQKGG